MTRVAEHDSFHVGYLLHYVADEEAIRDMIAAHVRVTRDLGSSKRAADLSIVKRRFHPEYPEDIDAVPSLDLDCATRFLASQILLYDSRLLKKPFNRSVTLPKD
jgi:hypothetical protein